MSKRMNVLMLVVVSLVSAPAIASWQVYSEYHFTGGSLLDSGPGHHDLTAIGTPDVVTPGSDGTGNAIGFVYTGGNTYPAPVGSCEGLMQNNFQYDVNLNTKGLQLDFWSKAGNDQKNNYPKLATQMEVFDLQLLGSISGGIYTNTGIRFSTYSGAVAKSVDVSGSFVDDVWHHIIMQFDPVSDLMSLDVDGTVRTVLQSATINTRPQSNRPLLFGTGHVETSGHRGLTGEMDEIIVSIPEPATMSLLLLGGLAAIKRRSLR